MTYASITATILVSYAFLVWCWRPELAWKGYRQTETSW